MFFNMLTSEHSSACSAAVALVLLTLLTAQEQVCNAEGPRPLEKARVSAAKEKTGLAMLYPDDEGIERDRRVLFVEDFETGAPEQIGARWGQISHKENIALSDDVHAGSPGSKSIHYRNNAHLFTHTKGVDTMYTRFYVKFHEKTGYIHHFVHLVADGDPKPWPKGGAGETPAGDAKFSTGIEPTGRWGKFSPPGVWNFYTYWHEMKTKWGTVYNGKQEPIAPGRWYCIEVMLKANSSPEKADGEQAFWVDGELYGRFTGFRWRTTNELKINTFWLLYYNTDQPARHNKDPRPQDRVMEVWFDDIVIATEYIGPIRNEPNPAMSKPNSEIAAEPGGGDRKGRTPRSLPSRYQVPENSFAQERLIVRDGSSSLPVSRIGTGVILFNLRQAGHQASWCGLCK